MPAANAGRRAILVFSTGAQGFFFLLHFTCCHGRPNSCTAAATATAGTAGRCACACAGACCARSSSPRFAEGRAVRDSE